MEQESREYLARRINEIAQERLQAKRVQLFGPTGRPQQPTWGMVFEGIRKGEIVLKADKVDYTGPYLNPTDVEWPKMDELKRELEAYEVMLEAEKQTAMDSVYLDSVAQEVLARFQKAIY